MLTRVSRLELLGGALEVTSPNARVPVLTIKLNHLPYNAPQLLAPAAKFRHAPLVLACLARARWGTPAKCAQAREPTELPPAYVKPSAGLFPSCQTCRYANSEPLVSRTQHDFAPDRALSTDLDMNVATIEKHSAPRDQLLDFAPQREPAKIRPLRLAGLSPCRRSESA